MKNKIMSALIAIVVSMLMIINQNTIVKAWDMVSNYAKGFIAVPADGSKGFNKNNLVALDASGKLPKEVLPASAGVGGGGGLFYSCGPCPAGSQRLGKTIIHTSQTRHRFTLNMIHGNYVVTATGYVLAKRNYSGVFCTTERQWRWGITTNLGLNVCRI